MKALKKYATKNNMLIGGGFLAAGIVLFLITRGKKEEAVVKAAGGASNEPDYINTEFRQPTDAAWPLKLGSGTNTVEKASVKVVQRWLNRRLPIPYSTLVIDGLFGVKTEAVLSSVTGKNYVTHNEFLKMASQLPILK